MPRENTRAAFIAGMDAGADGFELDVFLLADNTVIVFHDEDTERLTGVKGDITKMTLEDMRKTVRQRGAYSNVGRNSE